MGLSSIGVMANSLLLRLKFSSKQKQINGSNANANPFGSWYSRGPKRENRAPLFLMLDGVRHSDQKKYGQSRATWQGR